MSVAVHEHDRDAPASRAGRERLVVLAAVLATLGVIAGPGLVAGLGVIGGLVPVVPEERLTDNAQRALDELPGAYATGGVVVVPASSDPHVVWIGAIAGSNVSGQIVDLGVRGLVPFGTLPTRGTTSEWRSQVEAADRIFSDVGPLYFACVPALSGQGCTGTVLMQHQGRWYALGGGAGAPGDASAARVGVLAGGGEATVWFGWVPPGAASAWATVVGHQAIREVPAHTAATGAGDGATMWWIRSSEAVSAVTFKDAGGGVVGHLPVGD